MSTEYYGGLDITMKAASDLSTKQFYIAKLSAADTFAISAAADLSLGVLQNKPKLGEPGNIRVLGISKVISDGSGTAIAVGDRVGPNASGKLVKKATADYNCIGIALEASTTDGAIISVLLIPGMVFRTLGG